jgi:two-component system chemotaxis sensor kinase CheA
VTSPPDDRMSELHDLFFESAGELVQALNEQALALEKSPGDAETLRGIRRTVHTLKGDAAACGFNELSELAHEFEDVLTLENPAANPLVPDVALRAADVFVSMLERLSKSEKDSRRRTVARRDRTPGSSRHESGGGQGLRKETSKRAVAVVPWSEYAQVTIDRAMGEGKRVYHVRVQLDPQCAMPIAACQLIQVALSSLGEVLATYPEKEAVVSQLEIALASEKSAEVIRSKCRIPTIAQSAKVVLWKGKASSSAPVVASPEPESAGPAVAPSRRRCPPMFPQTSRRPRVASSTTDNTLRVDAEKIDTVLNLVGELILAKSMWQQALNEFGQRFPKDDLRGKFSDVMAFQSRALNDLQRSVMKIRMVPVEQLFRRFPRVVRDVARQCGKDIELVVKGADTDLDKRILDALAEPLTHLVRNAIGHGIETSAERVRAGKPGQGTLRLNAYHQGNQVVIEVSDDGNGIEVTKVRQRALSQGLLTAEEAAALSDGQTVELILRPGFSTAAEITELVRTRCRTRRRAQRDGPPEGDGTDRNRSRPRHYLPATAAAYAGHY